MASPSSGKAYHRTRRLVSLAAFLADLGVLVLLLFTGWTISLRGFAEQQTRRPALALLVYLGLFGAMFFFVGLPFDFLKGYWLEHRYRLSNLTLGGWIKDRLKALALEGLLSGLGVEIVYKIMWRWPGGWWVISAAIFVALFVLMANLAPVLIFPIFFKFKPLENSSLADRLLTLSRHAGARVRGIYEWKLSAKSKKANAALVGLGNTRRVILSDTLLERFHEDEVEAVVAHELGHHAHHHMTQGLAVQTAATFLGFYLANAVLQRLSRSFGFAGLADFANLPLLLLVGLGLSVVLLPAVNAHSRHLERQADAYALRAIAEKSVFISGMEKLADLNLAERKPHPWIEFIFYSHPSIEKRIAFARNFPG